MLQCHADQLAVAVRSPIPALEKQYHGAATLIGQGPRFASLVKQREVRRLIHQPNLDQVVGEFEPNAVALTDPLDLGGRGMPPIDVRVSCRVLVAQPQLSTATPPATSGLPAAGSPFTADGKRREKSWPITVGRGPGTVTIEVWQLESDG